MCSAAACSTEKGYRGSRKASGQRANYGSLAQAAARIACAERRRAEGSGAVQVHRQAAEEARGGAEGRGRVSIQHRRGIAGHAGRRGHARAGDRRARAQRRFGQSAQPCRACAGDCRFLGVRTCSAAIRQALRCLPMTTGRRIKGQAALRVEWEDSRFESFDSDALARRVRPHGSTIRRRRSCRPCKHGDAAGCMDACGARDRGVVFDAVQGAEPAGAHQRHCMGMQGRRSPTGAVCRCRRRRRKAAEVIGGIHGEIRSRCTSWCQAVASVRVNRNTGCSRSRISR